MTADLPIHKDLWEMLAIIGDEGGAPVSFPMVVDTLAEWRGGGFRELPEGAEDLIRMCLANGWATCEGVAEWAGPPRDWKAYPEKLHEIVRFNEKSRLWDSMPAFENARLVLTGVGDGILRG